MAPHSPERGVGLFFTGKGASLKFDRESTISLEAPETGVMAGLLIFSARSLTGAKFEILSDNAPHPARHDLSAQGRVARRS